MPLSNTTNSIDLTAIAGPGFTPQLWLQELSSWFSRHWLELAVALGAGIAIYLLLGLLQRFAANRVRQRQEAFGVRDILARTIARTGPFFRAMVAVELVNRFAFPPAGVARLIHFLFTVAAVWQVAVWTRELVLGLVERRAGEGQSHETLANALSLIRILVSVVVFAVALVVILDNVGVNVTGLIAGLGIGGIAIGLAAQGIFADLFAALAIIFDRPFQRGETINYGTATGTVERVGLKSTRLRAVTGEELVISNKNLLDKEIINYTRLNRRRTTFQIGLIYQTRPQDLGRVAELLKSYVEAASAVFVRAGFVGFGDSAVNFTLEFDVMSEDYEVLYQTRSRIGIAILEGFAKEGLDIAYPTQTTFTAAPDGRMILPYPPHREKSASEGDSASPSVLHS